MIDRITKRNIVECSIKLAESDPRLLSIYSKYGAPPLWAREPEFETLIRIILEQQVSLASARAAFDKLKSRLGQVTPEAILSLDNSEMKAVYFSRQKASYARCLSEAVVDGSLDLALLPQMADEDVRRELTRIKGIGRWTADIFLLMALLRPDVMPRGDIALYAAWKDVAGLEVPPSPDEFEITAKKWSPLRSVAARLLWHYYLSERGSG